MTIGPLDGCNWYNEIFLVVNFGYYYRLSSRKGQYILAKSRLYFEKDIFKSVLFRTQLTKKLGLIVKLLELNGD